MNTAPEIRFLSMPASAAVLAAAERKAERLSRLRKDLMSCRISIERLHKHQHQGQPYGVRIDLTLPGHELVVDRVQHEDVYVALRDAFDSMRRQIEQTTQRRRGQVKQHPAPLHGEVLHIHDEARQGIIQTADGNQYWFSSENLAGIPFEHVTPGTPVQFLPELAAEGLQAKRVSVGKHRFS